MDQNSPSKRRKFCLCTKSTKTIIPLIDQEFINKEPRSSSRLWTRCNVEFNMVKIQESEITKEWTTHKKSPQPKTDQALYQVYGIHFFTWYTRLGTTMNPNPVW